MINPGQILQDRYQAIQLLGDCGFGQTWEVDDCGIRKIMKILQVPKAIDDQKMEQVISLFEQEANVLIQLHDVGLPTVKPEAYFIESTEDVGPLHCLVMEKIEGINLSEWLKYNHQNQPIEEEQAIAWLTQLVQIISKLHQHHCIHRDIKPTNIILRSTVPHEDSTIVQQSENLSRRTLVQPTNREVTKAQNLSRISLMPKNVAQLRKNKKIFAVIEGDRSEVENNKNQMANQEDSQKQDWGQLALIDFGASREITETYLRQVEGNDVTGIISQGYTSPEQYEGKVTRQSDVFAIGRTLVYLLTAENPIDLPKEPETGRLMWRDHATHISQKLADLIDEMMENLPQCRPQTNEDILERLDDCKEQVETETEVEIKPTQKQQQPTPVTKKQSSSRPLHPKLLNFKGKTTPEPNKWLGKVSLLTLGVIAVLIAFLPETPTTCPLKFDDKLSCGEEILIPGSATTEKEAGVKAFADGNYLQAVTLLEAARKKQINDPETLIYLNNARLAANNTEAYTIAVAVPMTGESRALNYSLEILRGVAQAQNIINQSDTADPTLRELPIGGKGLTVIIADDVNSSTEAVRRANALATIGQVLAVVGHLSSQITMEVAPTYEDNKLVLIAPTTNASKLSNRNDFFFRMIPSDATIAQAMASYLISQSEDKQPKVALFHTPNDIHSESLKSKFSLSFTAGRGKIVKDLDDKFDLSRTAFNASAALSRADKKEATAIVLLPDTFSLSKGIEVIKANWQLNLPIIAGDSLYSDYTLKFGAEEAEKNLVVATPWHSLNSPNLDFPQQAKELWGGAVSWRTAFAYDSVQALIKALESLPQQKEFNRIALQKVLAGESFSSYGATGEITFLGNGDRQESRVSFTQVVKSSCSPLGYTFLPLDYPVSNLNLLECEE